MMTPPRPGFSGKTLSMTPVASAAVFQALPGAGFIVNGVALIAKPDGELASRSQTYAGIGTLRYSW